MELLFFSYILPNWFPIIVAWFVFGEFRSVKSELGDVKSELEKIRMFGCGEG